MVVRMCIKHLNIRKYTLELTFIVGFALLCKPSVADINCHINIEVSDDNSAIVLDGKKIGQAPLSISCSNQERLLEVQSASGQHFSRTLPTTDFINDENRIIRVYFEPNLTMKSVKFADSVSPTNEINVPFSTKSVSHENEKLYSEIKIIKQRLALLEDGLNSKYNNLKLNQTFSVEDKALVQSASKEHVVIAPPNITESDVLLNKNILDGFLTRSISSLKAGFSPGYYVQLFTLRSKTYDIANIKSVLLGGENAFGGAIIKFCKWSIKDDYFAQILVGPFDSIGSAKTVKEFVKKDSFILRKNSCEPLIDDIVFQ
jgi:hypothetical protein